MEDIYSLRSAVAVETAALLLDLPQELKAEDVAATWYDFSGFINAAKLRACSLFEKNDRLAEKIILHIENGTLTGDSLRWLSITQLEKVGDKLTGTNELKIGEIDALKSGSLELLNIVQALRTAATFTRSKKQRSVIIKIFKSIQAKCRAQPAFKEAIISTTPDQMQNLRIVVSHALKRADEALEAMQEAPKKQELRKEFHELSSQFSDCNTEDEYFVVYRKARAIDNFANTFLALQTADFVLKSDVSQPFLRKKRSLSTEIELAQEEFYAQKPTTLDIIASVRNRMKADELKEAALSLTMTPGEKELHDHKAQIHRTLETVRVRFGVIKNSYAIAKVELYRRYTELDHDFAFTQRKDVTKEQLEKIFEHALIIDYSARVLNILDQIEIKLTLAADRISKEYLEELRKDTMLKLYDQLGNDLQKPEFSVDKAKEFYELALSLKKKVDIDLAKLQ